MHKRLTITLDEAVYEGLCRTVGRRRMSQFIEELLRPHVLDTSLDEGYRAMAADPAREAEAQAWCKGPDSDMRDEHSALDCQQHHQRTDAYAHTVRGPIQLLGFTRLSCADSLPIRRMPSPGYHCRPTTARPPTLHLVTRDQMVP